MSHPPAELAYVLDDAQPFFYRQPGVLMAHNGGLTNYDDLRASLAAPFPQS